MDWNYIQTSVVGVVIAFISSATTYFFARKKYNNDVVSGTIKNKQSELQYYKDLTDDMTKRLQILLTMREEDTKKMDMMSNKIDTLEMEIRKLNNELMRKNEIL